MVYAIEMASSGMIYTHQASSSSNIKVISQNFENLQCWC
jgi:hypothetical protein